MIRPANADLLFSNEASFLAAVPGTIMESFEALVAANTSNASLIDLGLFAIGATPANALGRYNVNVLGTAATDGSKYIRWVAAASSGTVAFTFDNPISAFAVTLTDALDGGSNAVARLDLTTNGGASFLSFFSGVQPSGQSVFLGLLADNPFTQIVLTNHNTVPDGIGIDEVRFLTAVTVPEPRLTFLAGSVLLMGAGFALGNTRHHARS